MEYKDPGRYILLYTYYILGVPGLGFPVESLYPRYHLGGSDSKDCSIRGLFCGPHKPLNPRNLPCNCSCRRSRTLHRLLRRPLCSLACKSRRVSSDGQETDLIIRILGQENGFVRWPVQIPCADLAARPVTSSRRAGS